MDDPYTLVKTIIEKSCDKSFECDEDDDDFEEYVRKLVAIAVDLQEDNLKNLEDRIEENIKKILLKEDIVKFNHKKTLKRINPRRNKTHRIKH